MINKGFKHDIKIGSGVRSGSYFIGKVVGVNYLTSRVLLVNDLNSKIPVIIEPIGSIITGILLLRSFTNKTLEVK